MKIKKANFYTQVVIPIIFVGFFIVSVLYSIFYLGGLAQTKNNQDHIRQAVMQINEHIAKVSFSLAGIRSLYLSSEEVNSEEFISFFDNLYSSMPEFSAIKLITPDFHVKEVYPNRGTNSILIGQDLSENQTVMALLNAAKINKVMTSGTLTPLHNGFIGLDLYNPIYKGEKFIGVIVATIKVPELLNQARETLMSDNFQAVIRVQDMYLDVNGYALYNNQGERILAEGVIVSGASGAPNWSEFEEENVRRLFMGDTEWLLMLQPPPLRFLVGYFYCLGTGLLVLMGVSYFLIMLYRQRYQLEQVNQREREFVSLVSHQLRAPLTQLSWGCEAILDVKELPAEVNETLTDMASLSRRSAKLVSDLLNLSRIERGVLRLNLEQLDATVLINEILLPIKKAASEAGIKLAVSCEPGLKVFCDRIKTEEAIRNICDNAIKYSDSGKLVEIDARLSLDGQWAIIEISDRGMGIPDQLQKNIFDKSSLANNKGPTNGAGLGLFLTKKFIELSGGKISFVTSRKGTVFKVELPTGGTTC